MEVLFTNDQSTVSCGRNGSFRCTGLNLLALDLGADQARHCFTLEGITSRGGVATGHLAIPVADVPAVITELQELLHSYHRAQGSPYGYEQVINLPNQPDGRLIVALPCGREAHLHRDNDNIGTIIDVLGGPQRRGGRKYGYIL